MEISSVRSTEQPPGKKCVKTGKSERNDEQAATFMHYISEIVKKYFTDKISFAQAKMFCSK